MKLYFASLINGPNENSDYLRHILIQVKLFLTELNDT